MSGSVAEYNYQPGGFRIDGDWGENTYLNNEKYQYNSIEYVEDHGLDLSMATYRMLDSKIGRWLGVDPRAEMLPGMTPFNSLANSPLTYSDPDGDLPILAGIALVLGSSFAINAGINALSKAGVAVGGGGQGIGLYRQGGGGFGLSPPKNFGHDYFYNPDGSLAWVDYNDPDNHTYTNLSIAAGALTVSGSRPGFWDIVGQNRFRHWPQTGTGFGLSSNPLFPQYSAYTEGVSNITWDLMSPVMLGLAGGGFASNVGGLYRGSLSFGRFLRGGKNLTNGVMKGPNVVYEGFDAVGTVRYVGITSRNPLLRFGEHFSSGTAKSLLDYRVINGATNLNRTQARVLEQRLINQYGLGKNGGQLLNRINSIAPKHWWQYGIK